jgi:hypothetical protein
MDYGKLLQHCYNEYSRYASLFCTFFFVRCTFIHFNWGTVPNPWIIDAHFYFGAILGIIITVPIIAILNPSIRESL